MAELLYRLGTFSSRRPWRIILAWIVILAIAVGAFLIGFRGLVTAFDIPGTASGQVTDQLQKKLPKYSGASGTVVYSTKDGAAFSAGQRNRLSDIVTGADELTGVSSVVDPFTAEAGREQQTARLADADAQLEAGRAQLDAAQAQLDASPVPQPAALSQLAASRAELVKQSERLADATTLLRLSSGIRTVSADGSAAVVNIGFDQTRLELSDATKQRVISYFEKHRVAGVEVSISNAIAQGVPQLVGVGEVVGVIIAGIVLFVMLGTIIAAALPVVTALLGVAIGVIGSLSLSGVIPMPSPTPILGVMLGLAVGIDYSLFILHRHRKQLLQGAELRESIGLANGTAGNAVVFAGVTVIVALIALNVTGIPFVGLMGSVGAVCVAIAILIAVTLTPALLGLAGERILSRRARARAAAALPARVERPTSTVRAVLTVIVAAAVLLTIAVPALSMRLGLPDGSSEAVDSTQYRADRITAEKFGAGANGPLLVTATLPSNRSTDDSSTDDSSTDDSTAEQARIATLIAKEHDVVAVAPIAVSKDGTLAAFQVLPKGGPNSESTETLVKALRATPTSHGDLGVAGQSASNIDISQNLANILPGYLALVVGLSLIILIGVFRSLLLPLIATGGFILSLVATYGALTAVFQWGWLGGVFGVHSPGPIVSFLPVILVGILFGLAMDYQLFLASGMREAYVHGSPARVAVTQGFRAGRTVVIAAALIMVSVFGGFVFSESIIIRALGFGLAFGVLVDAFVVRLLIVPALMHLFGTAVWWIPRWLDRILPNIDVEGAALERKHHLS